MGNAIVKLNDLDPEIHAALARRGVDPAEIVLLSPLGEKKGRRCAYRVDDKKGAVVKVRLFESCEEAERVCRLRAGLEEAFAPVLACQGKVLVEEWVEGVRLSDLDWGTWVEPAGALLGRLHSSPLPQDEPPTVSTRRWLDGALADLDRLSVEGTFGSEQAACLRTELEQRDPRRCRTVLIHTDFCAENMVIDTRGRLRVIDNEGLAIRPAGFDLGRTFQLWPMTDDKWLRFRRGYLSSAPGEPGASGFWRIVAVLLGTRIFRTLSPERFEASVTLLRRFLVGEQLTEAAE